MFIHGICPAEGENMQSLFDKYAESVYQFLLKCGNEHDPYHFCGTAARELNSLVSYDQARVIFLDTSGKIYSSVLYGVSKKTWQNFMSWYSDDLIGSKYSLKEPLHVSEDEKVALCDWTDPATCRAHDLFAASYVRPLHLKYCLGIGLTDNHGCLRCIISLDRIRAVPYTEKEIASLRKLYPLLNNYFVNFFTEKTEKLNLMDHLLAEYNLTPRENEIAQLILKGASAKAVAERLCISVTTTYKHIANMYKKMNVTNRQEFIARLHEKERL